MKTLRFIGMAIIAVVISVNFVACSSDDDDENESNSPLVGTWVNIENRNSVEYKDVQTVQVQMRFILMVN